jgi:hypothetical protein
MDMKLSEDHGRERDEIRKSRDLGSFPLRFVNWGDDHSFIPATPSRSALLMSVE